MQDINQQLYERKDIPKEFIPNYGVIVKVNVPEDKDIMFSNWTLTFECNKTYEEVKNILLQGGLVIIEIHKNSQSDIGYFVCNSYNIFEDSFFTFSNYTTSRELWEYVIEWSIKGGQETKKIVSDKVLQTVDDYNIDSITNAILTNKSDEEVLKVILDIFTNFEVFRNKIKSPFATFYNKYGKLQCNAVDDEKKICISWNDVNKINHCIINYNGSYVYNTIQIVDQTLYRLSNLTIDPIVNPKIWVGTATQYAAIAQKDNNTTYIVKSDA